MQKEHSPGVLPPGKRNGSKLGYTRRQLSEELGISIRSIARAEKRGQIRSLKLWRTKLYAHTEVERFLRRVCKMSPQKVAATKALLESFGCCIIDAEQRLITCPGKSLHTTANADADGTLFCNENGSVLVYCHHKSCRDVIEDVNCRLAAIHEPYNTRRRRPIPRLDRERLTKEARRELLDKFAWSNDKIIADSDDAIQAPVEQHHLQVLGLFDDDDVVWCGRDVWDTGSPNHACRFRPVKEWLAEDRAPGPIHCSKHI